VDGSEQVWGYKVKLAWVMMGLASCLLAEPVVLNAHCSHSFELDASFKRFDTFKESFDLVVVIDAQNQKAYTKGFGGMQGELHLLHADNDSATMLEPLLDGSALYHWSRAKKMLFVSKTYEWFNDKKAMPIVLTIVCKVD